MGRCSPLELQFWSHGVDYSNNFLSMCMIWRVCVKMAWVAGLRPILATAVSTEATRQILGIFCLKSWI